VTAATMPRCSRRHVSEEFICRVTAMYARPAASGKTTAIKPFNNKPMPRQAPRINRPTKRPARTVRAIATRPDGTSDGEGKHGVGDEYPGEQEQPHGRCKSYAGVQSGLVVEGPTPEAVCDPAKKHDCKSQRQACSPVVNAETLYDTAMIQ